jgi:hypothetical protein
VEKSLFPPSVLMNVSAHIEPAHRSNSSLPEVETLAISLDESGWFETSFVCYACEASGNFTSINADERTSPWIFASNAAQTFESASDELTPHRRYGHFYLDKTTQEANSASSYIPVINLSAPDQPTNDMKNQGSSTRLFDAHGLLLGISIMILYPCGALAIRSGLKRSFQLHLLFQVSASVFCLGGALIAVYGILTKRLVRISSRLLFKGLALTSRSSRLTFSTSHTLFWVQQS